MIYFFLLNDIDICNFPDNTAAYACDIHVVSLIQKLEENFELAVTWFEKNYMKLNTDRCHLIEHIEHFWKNIWTFQNLRKQ